MFSARNVIGPRPGFGPVDLGPPGGTEKSCHGPRTEQCRRERAAFPREAPPGRERA